MQTLISFGLAGAAVAAALTAAPAAHAAVVEATPANYRARLARLQPGDVLRLAPGEYVRGLPIHGLNGEPGAPIRIEGRDLRNRPRFVAQPGQNTVSIVDSSYVEIAGLDLDGAGVPVDAVKAEGHARFAHHITIQDLRIYGYGAGQQIIGISTKCPAWSWVIRRNVIIGAGTGIYLGDSDGGDPFIGGLIEGNLVRDTLGYNLQIKHQRARPDLPGMPSGPSTTVIRHNVFSKAANASTADLARPNVLVGHFPSAGPGADDLYLIYGNFFHENPTEALFQGEGSIALYSNVFVNASGSAVRIQPHNGRPESIDVFGNTVIARDDGISIVGGNPERRQRAFGNAVFAGVPITADQASGNVVGDLAAAARLLRDSFAPLGKLDLAPREPGAMQVDWPEVPDRATDALLDFDTVPRSSGTAGAYARGPAKWRLALERKPHPAQVSPFPRGRPRD